MDDELRNLRRELSRGSYGQGIGYPDLLRERIIVWARRRRAGGATLRGIAGEVGVSAESLRRWMLSNAAPALIPIEVMRFVIIAIPGSVWRTIHCSVGATLNSPQVPDVWSALFGT